MLHIIRIQLPLQFTSEAITQHHIHMPRNGEVCGSSYAARLSTPVTSHQSHLLASQLRRKSKDRLSPLYLTSPFQFTVFLIVEVFDICRNYKKWNRLLDVFSPICCSNNTAPVLQEIQRKDPEMIVFFVLWSNLFHRLTTAVEFQTTRWSRRGGAALPSSQSIWSFLVQRRSPEKPIGNSHIEDESKFAGRAGGCVFAVVFQNRGKAVKNTNTARIAKIKFILTKAQATFRASRGRRAATVHWHTTSA